jgi:hypothetical protein
MAALFLAHAAVVPAHAAVRSPLVAGLARRACVPVMMGRKFAEFPVLETELREYLSTLDDAALHDPDAPLPLSYLELQSAGRADLAEGCMQHGGYLAVSDRLGVRTSRTAPNQRRRSAPNQPSAPPPVFGGVDTASAAGVTLSAASFSHDGNDEAFVSVTTREERDDDGRKRAIDLEPEESRKQARTALPERVAEARSLCTAAVDERYRALIKPAFDAWAADEIDEDELKARKPAARKQAAAEHEPLAALDGAYGAYTAAIAARVAAEAAEEKAEAEVDAVVRAIEQQAAAAGGGVGALQVNT